jgi:hypothetical protein
VRRAAPAAALLLAAALAGCGTSGDRDQARAVTERFYAAVRSHHGRAACPKAVGDLRLKGGKVVRARVYITNAVVELTGGESAFLGREPDGWKLSAVGCRLDRAKPRDRPAECEAQD